MLHSAPFIVTIFCLVLICGLKTCKILVDHANVTHFIISVEPPLSTRLTRLFQKWNNLSIIYVDKKNNKNTDPKRQKIKRIDNMKEWIQRRCVTNTEHEQTEISVNSDRSIVLLSCQNNNMTKWKRWFWFVAKVFHRMVRGKMFSKCAYELLNKMTPNIKAFNKWIDWRLFIGNNW